MTSAPKIGVSGIGVSRIGEDAGDAVLMEQLSSPISAVAGRESPWGFRLGMAGTIGLGLLVYVSMSAGRHARAQTIVHPPVRLAMADPVPSLAPAPVMASPPPSSADVLTAPVNSGDEAARLRAPSMVVDLSEAPDAGTAAATPAAGAAGAAAGAPTAAAAKEAAAARAAGTGSDERFAERIGATQVDTARATRLANLSLIAPQGTVISAVLETGINSDLPGFVRGVVTRDVSGFDGTTVVIPRGTRLIGEYKSGVADGQTRAFVIWSRLLTPDGISVNLASPATDRLGRGGLDGSVNNHFFQRFGAAILLSVINGGVEALANQASSSNGVNAIVIGSPQQATSVASIALQKDIDIPTTITVPQGKAIRVFVSRDLDFSDVLLPTR